MSYDVEGELKCICFIDVPPNRVALREAVFNILADREHLGTRLNLDLGRGNLSLGQRAQIQKLTENLAMFKGFWGKPEWFNDHSFALKINSVQWLTQDQLDKVEKGDWSDLKFEIARLEGLHRVDLEWDCSDEIVSIVLDAAKALPNLQLYYFRHKSDKTLTELCEHLKERIDNDFPVKEVFITSGILQLEDVKQLLEALAKAKDPVELRFYNYIKREKKERVTQLIEEINKLEHNPKITIINTTSC